MILTPALLTLAVFAIAAWITGRVRVYAAGQLLDVPNARSSHVVATPRGGGVAIVLATLLALPALGALGALTWSNVWGLLGGGACVAAVGFADDHRHIAARWRLLGHFSAAAWLIWWLGGLSPVPLFGTVTALGWIGYALGMLFLVWMLNLTNFMDGIDGIASVEAATVCAGGAIVYAVAVPGSAGWLGPVVLAASTLGFLVWNWPPARIFMGDAGSGFLGFTLAAFALQAAWASPPLLWSWIILLSVFIVDATVTLIRRIIRGDRFYEAHRSHAYQHAAQRWGRHRGVTVTVGMINVGWLLPIALLVARGSLDGALGAGIASVPLVAASLWLRAGAPAP